MSTEREKEQRALRLSTSTADGAGGREAQVSCCVFVSCEGMASGPFHYNSGCWAAWRVRSYGANWIVRSHHVRCTEAASFRHMV